MNYDLPPAEESDSLVTPRLPLYPISNPFITLTCGNITITLPKDFTVLLKRNNFSEKILWLATDYSYNLEKFRNLSEDIDPNYEGSKSESKSDSDDSDDESEGECDSQITS